MLLLYGWHACLAALQNPRRTVQHIWLTRESDKSKLPEASSRIPVTICSPKVVSEILAQKGSGEAVHQGIAMQVEPLPALNKTWSDGMCWVVLDHVTDPHNVGAILRVCAALGADGIIQTTRHAPPVTGALAKAASGALECVPMYDVTNLARTLRELKDEGFWVYGFTESGTVTLPSAHISGRVVYVFGAEGEGLRQHTMEMCDVLVKLPTTDHFSTLNVSHAVALALYERQRNG